MNLSKSAWLFSLNFLIGIWLVSSCQEQTHETEDMPQQATPATFKDGEELSGSNAWLHTKKFCELGPRPNGSKALDQSRDYITEYLQKLGWTVTKQSFEANTPLGKRSFTNLIARFQPDQAPKVATGIISGHIDTKMYQNIEFIGANDGASHSGLILELARILAKNPERARAIELVFFDGEEAFLENIIPGRDGLYGSIHYAKFFRALPKEQKPQWGINLDMVGHSQLRIEVPSDTPNQLYQTYRNSAKKLPQGRKRFGVSRNPIIDDHLPLNQVGIPTIDIIQGNFSGSNWWHQQGDTLDIISPASLELSGKLVINMLADLP